jgi:hypothetical protein
MRPERAPQPLRAQARKHLQSDSLQFARRPAPHPSQLPYASLRASTVRSERGRTALRPPARCQNAPLAVPVQAQRACRCHSLAVPANAGPRHPFLSPGNGTRRKPPGCPQSGHSARPSVHHALPHAKSDPFQDPLLPAVQPRARKARETAARSTGRGGGGPGGSGHRKVPSRERARAQAAVGRAEGPQGCPPELEEMEATWAGRTAAEARAVAAPA